MSEPRPGMRALQEALRSLEAQAKAARKRCGLPYSRNEVAKAVRKQHGGGPDARRVGEWLRIAEPHAPRDEDEVWALVKVWAQWAGQPMREEQRLYWNDLVRDAQPQARGRSTGTLVRECDPIRLGVHRPITVDSDGTLPTLPLYIERAHDRQVRSLLMNAQCNQMIVLTGGSSTGKTRAAWEAALACLPDWTLLSPSTADDLIQLADTGPVPARSVIWLNETQTYLNEGAAAARVLDLLGAPGPIVILGSMWPDHWRTLTTRPGPDQADSRRQCRELLTDHATEIPVPDSFADDPRALQRLSDLANHDPRLRIARATAGADSKVTQVLSGGTLLVRRYERATDPRSKAVITAGMDARRLGHQKPLPGGFLKDAVAGYLTNTQRATDPGWFDRALVYATEEERGIAALTPIQPGYRVGPTDLYVLHDYLDQHGRATRTGESVPADTWDALAICTTDPDDLNRLAYSARHRTLYRYAERLYRGAVAAGNSFATYRLVTLLGEQGREDELRGLAAAGLTHARRVLVDLLAAQGRADEAVAELALAEAGGTDVPLRLVELLAAQGREDDLRALADAGDAHARWRLSELLAAQGREHDLRTLADSGDTHARWRLASLLAKQGRVDEAIAELRTLVAAGHTDVREWLADLLIEQGRVDEAITELRALADGGDAQSQWRLVELLAAHGRDDDLRALAEADLTAGWRLAELLAAQGRQDDLRALAVAGNTEARRLLAALLAAQGREDDLGVLAATGDVYFRHGLVELLAAQGREDDLRELADAGHADARWQLAELLAKQGRVDEAIAELRVLADWPQPLPPLWHEPRNPFFGTKPTSGDVVVRRQLAELLAKQGRVDEATAELRALAATGDTYAGEWRLPDLLAEHGRMDEAIAELRALAATDAAHSQSRLVDLLAKQGQEEELRAQTVSGNPHARQRLVALLTAQGRNNEVAALKRFGLNPDGSTASPSDT